MSAHSVGGVRVACAGWLCAALLVSALGCALGGASAASREATEVRNAADVALAQGEPAAALAAYRKALALAPDDAAARRGEARALAALGDTAGALAAYDASRPADPSDRASLLRAEVCPLVAESTRRALEAGAIDAAVAGARRLESDPCERADASPLLGAALRAAGQRAERTGQGDAVALYMEAARLDPGHVYPYIRAAIVLMREGRRRAAIELLAEALGRHPRDPDLQALMVDALAGREAGTTRPARRGDAKQ